MDNLCRNSCIQHKQQVAVLHSLGIEVKQTPHLSDEEISGCGNCEENVQDGKRHKRAHPRCKNLSPSRVTRNKENKEVKTKDRTNIIATKQTGFYTERYPMKDPLQLAALMIIAVNCRISPWDEIKLIILLLYGVGRLRKMSSRPGTEKIQVFTWIFDPGMKFRPSGEDRD